jgi:hypothetical protein
LPADNLGVIEADAVITGEPITVAVDVPTNAPSIVIGCALAGNGTAWFGDLTDVRWSRCDRSALSRQSRS